jgi:hypothetical protein
VKNTNVVRNYYVLPCCLLLLNLCIEIVSYKVKVFDDAMLRTAAIMIMVLFGSSLVGFVVAPAIGVFVGTVHRGSRRGAGQLGEAVFLLFLGVLVFWLYYRVYNIGPQSVLPVAWHNSRH